jgi:hypothetical protein
MFIVETGEEVSWSKCGSAMVLFNVFLKYRPFIDPIRVKRNDEKKRDDKHRARVKGVPNESLGVLDFNTESVRIASYLIYFDLEC